MDGYPSSIEIVSRLSAIHNQEIMDTEQAKLNNNPQTYPNHQFGSILTHHLEEWKKSCVDEKLTFLNLISLIGFTVYEYLLYGLPDSERRNDGRLRDKWLNRYAHLPDGGWWVSGLDPLNNWLPMEWGRFKPDNPRLCGKKNKPIKYESPPKVANRVTYFNLPAHIWDKIAARYGIKRYHSPLAFRLADQINSLVREGQRVKGKGERNVKKTFSPSPSLGARSLASYAERQRSCQARSALAFCEGCGSHRLTFSPDLTEINWTKTSDKINLLIFWEWLQQHPSIPIILTEGEKKAATLLSMGFAAIALPGIWGGRVGSKHNEQLHPDLLPLAQKGRKFIILFDYETKPKTKYNIYQATLRTGEAIEKAGCRCEVASLPGSEKGVDDFVAARGLDASVLLTSIIDDALTLSEYKQVCYPRPRGLSNKYPFDIELKSRYLSKEIATNCIFFPDIHIGSAKYKEACSELENSSYYKELYSSIVNEDYQFQMKSIRSAFPDSGLVVLASGMGTGKTELMAQFRLANPRLRFLNLGHRVNLLKNLSERLKTKMYSDLESGKLTEALALSITIDSLYKLQNQLVEYGCVFIDEACQYLAHLLHSKTCKQHRAEILDVLEYIIGKARLVVIADAHMDDVTVDFFRAMRPEGEKPFIIKNNYQQGGRVVYLYESDDSSTLVLKIFTALMLGQKIMVVSDSKKFIKKLEAAMTVRVLTTEAREKVNGKREKDRCSDAETGRRGDAVNFSEQADSSPSTDNITKDKGFNTKPLSSHREETTDTSNSTPRQEKGKIEKPKIKNLPPSPLPLPLSPNDDQDSSNNNKENRLRIWSIHAENSGSEENIAFIKDISSEVKNVDVLLASPSLGTGVDIPEYHFDAVFGAFQAVSQTATECAQALHRYRPQVPLHIWVAPRPPFGYKETNAAKIKERMLQLNEMTAFLIRIDKETGKKGAEKDWALDAYCQIEANRNRSINNLRDDMRSLLTEMEYNIISVEAESDPDIKNQLREAGRTLDTAYNTAVAQASNISPAEYLNRQSKNYLSPEEVVECQKYRIQRDYGMLVTEELVKRDDGGHLISKLIALEGILSPSNGEIVDPATGKKYPAPPPIVAQRDLKERDNLPLCMDWHNYSGKWLARHVLGLPKILTRLLAAEEVTATDPDLVKMTEIAQASRAHIKAILGFTISPKCTPIWLLSTLLDQLGLKMTSRRKGGKGKQVRYYSLTVEDLSFAIDVLQHRERQREEKALKEQERLEKERIYQTRMQTTYGIDPPEPKVVTPPQKGNIYPLDEPLTTNQESVKTEETEYKDSLPNILNKLKPCLELLEGVIKGGEELIIQVMVVLLANFGGQKETMVLQHQLLYWLVRTKKLITFT